MQAQQLKATTNVRQVVKGTTFNVKYEINNNSISSLQKPDFRPFKIIAGPNKSMSTSIINGRHSSSSSYSFTLMATEEGRFTIPPAVLINRGKTISSNPLTIEVVKGIQKPDEDKYFIKVELDTDSIYVGQQIVMTIKLYSTITIERYDLMYMPDFHDVYIQELPRFGRKSQIEVVDGIQYQTQVLKRTALYAQKSGRFDFDGLVIRLGIPTNQRRSRSFFFSTNIKTDDVATNSFGFDVFPLPEPKPRDFSGGVGHYSASAHVDRTKLSTDDALTMTLTIQGDGDQRLLLPPEMELGDHFESYDANLVTTRQEANEERDRFTKVFEYLVIPNRAGAHWLKPHFTHFSPDSNKYITTYPDSFLLNVAQGTEESRALDKFREGQKVVLNPIIHTWDPEKKKGYLLHNPVFLGIYILLVLSLLTMIYFRRKQVILAQMDPRLLRSRRGAKSGSHPACKGERISGRNGFECLL